MKLKPKIHREKKIGNTNKWDSFIFDLIAEDKKKTTVATTSIAMEEEIESRMLWYYVKYHAQDLIILGRIPQNELNYEIIVDLDLRNIIAVYCSKGKSFNTEYIRNEFRSLGLDAITSLKLFSCLEDLRKKMPTDITKEEMECNEINRELPICVCCKYGYNISYRESYRTPELLEQPSKKLRPSYCEDFTQQTSSTEGTLVDVATQNRSLHSVSTQREPRSQDSDVSSLIIYSNLP